MGQLYTGSSASKPFSLNAVAINRQTASMTTTSTTTYSLTTGLATDQYLLQYGWFQNAVGAFTSALGTFNATLYVNNVQVAVTKYSFQGQGNFQYGVSPSAQDVPLPVPVYVPAGNSITVAIGVTNLGASFTYYTHTVPVTAVH